MPLTGKSFGAADHGIAWAASSLPKSFNVTLDGFKAAKGGDDYRVAFTGPAAATLSANSAVGAIGGLLKLAELVKSGKRKDCTSELSFVTRNYKHETHIYPGAQRSILLYTPQTWEGLCQHIVAGGFNGLTLYPGCHPFEDILDYKEFAHAASRPEKHRTAVRKALQVALAIAHRYGLKTFMQHYVNHFTQELADAEGIRCTGRLSAIDHPVVEDYCRWCYREIFKQLPDLDGLYFNYESTPEAHVHVLKTAIPEMNRAGRPLTMVHRLWNYTDYDGMRSMVDAFEGKTIISHKIDDTNDTYYLPKADSRVMEWKTRLPDVEFMFCAGPCHNCGTNLCGQLWADYDFVQEMLNDAREKGADSISFHTIIEFFCNDIPDPKGAFNENERNLARFNFLHVQAAIDTFNGIGMSRAQRVEFMAQRLGVKENAAAAFLTAVEASSQLVLLTYQQFCYGSAFDGYINPGRYSHIQDPFFFLPATGHNHQSKSLMWTSRPPATWVSKTIDTVVCPDNYVQHIIDYVDPAKPKATLNPRKIADQMKKDIATAFAAAKVFRKLSGNAKLADALDKYLAHNADLGNYIRREIEAAISMYSMYFAKSKAAMVAALKKGLAELDANVPLVADRKSPSYKSMERSLMVYLDPQRELAVVKETLALLQAADSPMPAFLDYIESHRQYNEIRRIIRPGRDNSGKPLAHAVACMNKAIANAQKSLAGLGDAKYAAMSANVNEWIQYLQGEVARVKPPKTACPAVPNGTIHSLHHEDCFRAGCHFLEDFISFFRRVDYLLPTGMSFQVWHTPKELIVRLREQGVNTRQRMDRWEEFKGSGSDPFVTQVHLSVDGKPAECYIIWPAGAGVSKGKLPGVEARAEFECDAVSWQTTAYLPYSLIGRKPKKGDVWKMNVFANPAIQGFTSYTWAPQYDGGGNENLFGEIKFE